MKEMEQQELPVAQQQPHFCHTCELLFWHVTRNVLLTESVINQRGCQLSSSLSKTNLYPVHICAAGLCIQLCQLVYGYILICMSTRNKLFSALLLENILFYYFLTELNTSSVVCYVL